MSKVAKDLSHIRAVIFDVDGVLSRQTIAVGEDGVPVRTVNVRDGYAIKQALENGVEVAIISGGTSEAIVKRYSGLGMKHIYMQASDKMVALHSFIEQTGLAPQDVLFCGDDIPDIPVMQYVGFAVAPKDAVPEVKAMVDYISPVIGGEGVARDILEEVLKVKGLWMHNTEAFGW